MIVMFIMAEAIICFSWNPQHSHNTTHNNSLSVQTLIYLYFFCFPEHQPRVRGWLLASADGQTTGLVPANYVKVLGKRRGRKLAELERLAQAQGESAPATQTASVAGLPSTPSPSITPGLGSATAYASTFASTSAVSEQLLESVYSESPTVNFNLGTQDSRMPSSTVLNISDKIDLWGKGLGHTLMRTCKCSVYTCVYLNGYSICLSAAIATDGYRC